MLLAPAIRRRPVASFWAIAVAIEIVLVPIFLLSGADGAIQHGLDLAGLDFNTDLVTAGRVVAASPGALGAVLLSLAQVASPDIAVLAVCALGLGSGALVEVRRRLRAWSADVGPRRGLALWAAVVALFTAMNLASAGLHALGPASMDFHWDPPALGPGLLGGLLVAMFLDAGALFEESGWRGFALPRLQARLTPVAAAGVLGLLWAAWHLPVKFDVFLSYGPLRGALLFTVLTAKFVALSVVISFFFNRAGEATLLAIAMHGLSNDSVRLGGLVDGEAFAAQLRAELDLLVPLAIVAGGLIWRTRGRLGVGRWEHSPVTLPRIARRAVAPLRAPARLAVGLAGVGVGLLYGLGLLVVVPVGVLLSVLGVGVALLLAGLVLARGLADAERRMLGATLGLDVEAALAGPRASHGLAAEVAALVRSPVTWRAVAWLAVRAAVSAVAAAALLVGGIVTVALLAIPFSDRWLEWGSFATHSGWAGAWTLLLVPGALLAIAHVLDLSVTVTAAVAPRLLGPDPRDELDALRRRAALLRDRSRLAAELHDGIGHTLTVVTLQANAAQRALDDDPEFARRALAAIEDAGRRAAGEMDGMLSALREEGPEPPGEPGLRGMLDLVDGLRAAGLPVELRTTGALGDVPDELGTEIYRMVQEACANVLRHAGRPMTLVAVEVTDRTVDVIVTNEQGDDDDTIPRRAGSGRGLPGIARRARRLGGSASTGASGDGGFLVSVRLPLPGA